MEIGDVSKNQINLIISDIRMPEMDWYELLKKVKFKRGNKDE